MAAVRRAGLAGGAGSARWLTSKLDEMGDVRRGRKFDRIPALCDRLVHVALESKSRGLLTTLPREKCITWLEERISAAANILAAHGEKHGNPELLPAPDIRQ